MTQQDSRIEKLMAQFREGDRDLIVDMAEIEAPRLFDYLFRMCGQRDTAMRVLDEAVVALKADLSTTFETLDDFRVGLYATARSFCSHIWNADTSELINEGYQGYIVSSGSGLNVDDLRLIEGALASMPGWEREAIVLRYRCGFSLESVAKIMLSSSQGVAQSINSAFLKIIQLHKNFEPILIEEGITLIPGFFASGTSGHGTMALSQIMGDIDQTKDSWFRSRWAMLVLLIVLALAIAGLLTLR